MKELKELTDKLKKTADEIREKVDRLNARFDESPSDRQCVCMIGSQSCGHWDGKNCTA